MQKKHKKMQKSEKSAKNEKKCVKTLFPNTPLFQISPKKSHFFEK